MDIMSCIGTLVSEVHYKLFVFLDTKAILFVIFFTFGNRLKSFRVAG